MTTICLNMIVKNEAHCIARCLKSVRPLIDHYVIVDTGSTDTTKEEIRRALEGIPGEIHDRPWKDFGHNRSEAIQLAVGKADYLLVVDADDEIVGSKPDDLHADTYHLRVEDSGLAYDRAHLFKANSSYRYVGVLHEYLESSNKAATDQFLPTLKYIRHVEGSSWGKRDGAAIKAKYMKDATVLEEALKKDPTNARYAFYLAQSWRDAGEPARAITAYEYRTTMPGWDEEKWYSLFQIAVLKRTLSKPQSEVIDAFLRAYEERPTRIESMWELGRYLQSVSRHRLCYFLLRPLVGTPFPKDRLYVGMGAYAWGLKEVFAGSAFFAGNFQIAKQLNTEILTEGRIPEGERPRIVRNLEACNKAIENLAVIENRPVPVVSPSGAWIRDQKHYHDAPLCYALARFFKGQSVGDFGCGNGDYVTALKKEGIQAKGFDGDPTLKSVGCQVADLSKRVELETFDWALSLEVGEHIPPEFEDVFLDNLHRHNRNGVVLSWAVIGQLGDGHVNCQNNEHVQEKMAALGYKFDVSSSWALRATAALGWFKQTLMVFRKV